MSAVFILSCSKGKDPPVAPIPGLQAPSHLHASTLPDGALGLFWTDESTDETGFQIYRGRAGSDLDSVTVVDADVTTYVDTGLDPSTTYVYRVFSINDAGPSVAYAEAVGTTQGEATAKKPWNGRSMAFTYSSDDGDIDNLDWVPVFRKHGLRFTVFVTSGQLGLAKKLNKDQVRDLDELGFEIASHTVTHPYLTTLNDQQLDWEIRESRDDLARIIGRPILTFAYPFHDHDRRVMTQVAKYYAAARDGGKSPAGHPSFSESESSWGKIDLFEVPLQVSILQLAGSNTVDEATLRAHVRSILVLLGPKRGWFNLYAHTVQEVDARHLEWILDELERNGDIWIGTFGELADYYRTHISAPSSPGSAAAPSSTAP